MAAEESAHGAQLPGAHPGRDGKLNERGKPIVTAMLVDESLDFWCPEPESVSLIS